MSLTWKDAVATVLVALAGIVTYARIHSFDWPLIGSWRSTITLLFALGLGTCIAAGSGANPAKDNWSIIGTLLGVFALGILVVGLFANNKIMSLVMMSDIAALWVLSTLHRIIKPGDLT